MKTMEERINEKTNALALENFSVETELLEQTLRNNELELNQFDLETSLLEKGVI